MPKNIVFCTDGTWNSPTEDQDHDHVPDNTNVYKLFLLLEGELSAGSLKDKNEQEKVLRADDGNIMQIGKYIHGVGDSENPIRKVLGGAFGSGTISRIVRGYTFISRHYEQGDSMYITGFSRGAYTARALAGFIAKQGLLAKGLTKNREQAYRKGAEAWYRYRDENSGGAFLARLAEAAADLPAFLSSKTLKNSDFVPVKEITAVGVRDTVGALGIPTFDKDSRRDAFRFTDTKLNPAVKWGFHAVSLDEQRVDFTPTLWTSRSQVKQMLFPGAHSDVGGGYPVKDNESGLSDGALEWMLEELKAVGLKASRTNVVEIKASESGSAHEPWRNTLFLTDVRTFPQDMIGHHSIALRAALTSAKADPEADAAAYQPTNKPRLICNKGIKYPDGTVRNGICAKCQHPEVA